MLPSYNPGTLDQAWYIGFYRGYIGFYKGYIGFYRGCMLFLESCGACFKSCRLGMRWHAASDLEQYYSNNPI